MAALCAALLFGAGTPLAKQLLAGVDPWMLAGLLYLGSGLGLGAWRLVRRAAPVKLPLDQWLWLGGAILAGGVAGPVLLMFGLVRMPASGASLLLNDLTLGVALGLLLGKVVGVFGSAVVAIRLGWADVPSSAGWGQLFGVSLLCGIGFTMSLFIGLLAFAGNATLQYDVKVGILLGSVVAALLGSLVMVLAPRPGGPESRED